MPSDVCEDIRHFQTQLQSLSFTTDELKESEDREFEEEQQSGVERRWHKENLSQRGNIKVFSESDKSSNLPNIPPPDPDLIDELDNTGVAHVPLETSKVNIDQQSGQKVSHLPSDPFDMVAATEGEAPLKPAVLEQLNDLKK